MQMKLDNGYGYDYKVDFFTDQRRFVLRFTFFADCSSSSACIMALPKFS